MTKDLKVDTILTCVLVVITIAAGIVLFLFDRTHQQGYIVTWIFGIISGYILYQTLVLKVGLNEKLKPIDNLKKYLDLNDDYQELENLYSAYSKITDEKFFEIKQKIIKKTQEDLTSIKNEKFYYINKSEFYNKVFSRLESTSDLSRVWAVSKSLDYEWNSSDLDEKRFIEANFTAASKGVELERIFIMPIDKINSFLMQSNDHPIKRHFQYCNECFNNSKKNNQKSKDCRDCSVKKNKPVKPYLVSSEELKNYESEFFEEIQGFIAFDNDTIYWDTNSPSDQKFVKVSLDIEKAKEHFTRLKRYQYKICEYNLTDQKNKEERN